MKSVESQTAIVEVEEQAKEQLRQEEPAPSRAHEEWFDRVICSMTPHQKVGLLNWLEDNADNPDHLRAKVEEIRCIVNKDHNITIEQRIEKRGMEIFNALDTYNDPRLDRQLPRRGRSHGARAQDHRQGGHAE